MDVFHNFTCIYHDFDATVVKQKLADNIVTVSNNVLHIFLKIFAVVKFFLRNLNKLVTFCDSGILHPFIKNTTQFQNG